MPKAAPETLTVPLYNPDGSLLGYTTPEKYAELGEQLGALFDSGTWQSADPNIGHAGAEIADMGWEQMNYDDMLRAGWGWADNPYYGDTPSTRVLSTGGARNPEYNFDGTPVANDRDLENEGVRDISGNPIYDPANVDWNYSWELAEGGTVDPGRPIGGGDNTGTGGPGGPGGPGTGGPGTGGPGTGGPGTGGPGGDGYNPGAPSFGGGGGGGVTPVGGGTPGQGLPDNPLIGYEGSTNQDFYQEQFKNMRDRRGGEMMKEWAAALRGHAAQNAPPAEAYDPWAWAGGNQSLLPQVSTGEPNAVPTEYQLNPNYGLDQGMSNQEMLQNIMPTFSESEQVFLNKHPDYINQGDWSTRQGVMDWASANPYMKDKGWTTVVNDIARNVWTPSATTAGPGAPAGYAYPVAGGAA